VAEYSKLDHATLVRNLNAVCKELASLIHSSGRQFGGPPPLTYGDVEDNIPFALYRIAVVAGWIEEQVELEEDEYYRSEDADLFGGCLWFRASFKEWFLGLVATTFSSLEEIAEKNEGAQNQHYELMQKCFFAVHRAKGAEPPQTTEPDNPAKNIIDEFFNKSKTIKTISALANEATKRKADCEQYPINRVTVSNIYHGYGAVRIVLEIVASVISELVPCPWNVLKATKRRPAPSKQ